MWVSTALTLTRIGTAHRRRNRRIPTIPAERADAGLANVSAVDTRPRRSESEVLTAQPSTSVTGPPPPSPARRLRMVPVVMVGRQHRPELAQVGPSRPAPRGSGSTGQGLCVLHEGPTYLQHPQPSSSSTPPLVPCIQTTPEATTVAGAPRSARLKQQLSHLADAPHRCREMS